MGIAAFNRARRQQEALADAKARDDAEQQKPLTEKYSSDEIAKFTENNDLMASPPYADVGQLINIPADADPDREKAAMEQAKLNRERILTEEERWQLQNAHFRDAKTKAIPDHDEAGQDRTKEGQKASRQKASAPYEDPSVPQHDGSKRIEQPWEERPDSDTSVSEETAQDAVPPSLDDDPATVGKIIDEDAKPTERDIPEESLTPVIKAPEPKKADAPAPVIPTPDESDAEPRAEAPKAEPVKRGPGRTPKAQG